LKRALAAVRLLIFANNYSCPFCSETLDSDKLVQGSSHRISRDCVAGVVSSCYIGEGQGLVHSLWVSNALRSCARGRVCPHALMFVCFLTVPCWLSLASGSAYLSSLTTLFRSYLVPYITHSFGSQICACV
jgi:hypothetical protein